MGTWLYTMQVRPNEGLLRYALVPFDQISALQAALEARMEMNYIESTASTVDTILSKCTTIEVSADDPSTSSIAEDDSSDTSDS